MLIEVVISSSYALLKKYKNRKKIAKIYKLDSKFQNGDDFIKTYLIRFRMDLFEKVKLLAKTYNISINKMMIRLLEIGYLEFIKSEIGEKTI